MRKHCGEENSGWLHLGRSSPSIRVVASRIAFRKLQMQIMASVNDLRGGCPRRSLHPAPQTLAARSGGPGCRSRRPAQTVSKAVWFSRILLGGEHVNYPCNQWHCQGEPKRSQHTDGPEEKPALDFRSYSSAATTLPG
jgi:hypothetical protein